MTRGYLPTDIDEQYAVVLEEVKKLGEMLREAYWKKAPKIGGIQPTAIIHDEINYCECSCHRPGVLVANCDKCPCL